MKTHVEQLLYLSRENNDKYSARLLKIHSFRNISNIKTYT